MLSNDFDFIFFIFCELNLHSWNHNVVFYQNRLFNQLSWNHHFFFCLLLRVLLFQKVRWDHIFLLSFVMALSLIELRYHLKSLLKHLLLALLISAQKEWSLFHFYNQQLLSLWSIFGFNVKLLAIFVLVDYVQVKSFIKSFVNNRDNIATLQSRERFNQIRHQLFTIYLSVLSLSPIIVLSSLFFMFPLFFFMFPFFLFVFPFPIINSIIRLFHPLSFIMVSNHRAHVFLFGGFYFLMASKNRLLFCILHPFDFIMISNDRMLFSQIPFVVLSSSNQSLLFTKSFPHFLLHFLSMLQDSLFHLFLELFNLFIYIGIEHIFHLDLVSINSELWHEGAQWRQLLDCLPCNLDLNLWIFDILFYSSLDQILNLMDKLLSSELVWD